MYSRLVRLMPQVGIVRVTLKMRRRTSYSRVVEVHSLAWGLDHDIWHLRVSLSRTILIVVDRDVLKRSGGQILSTLLQS
jgi:hypothetical protein